MRYIINEEQNMLVYVLRRVNQDFDLIWEIVDEGIDMYLCNIDTFREYYDFVCLTSAKTYLYNYFNSEKEKGYLDIENYIIDFIKENFTVRIIEYWSDNKGDC